MAQLNRPLTPEETERLIEAIRKFSLVDYYAETQKFYNLCMKGNRYDKVEQFEIR